MSNFKSEFDLSIKKKSIEQKIGDAQSRFKKLKVDTAKCEKEINTYNKQLTIVDEKIVNSRELYKNAFSFICKNEFGGNVDKLIKVYP